MKWVVYPSPHPLTLPLSLPCPPWTGSQFLPAPSPPPAPRWESREPLPASVSARCARLRRTCMVSRRGGGRGTGGGLRKQPPFEVSRTFRPASPKQTSGGPDDKGRKATGPNPGEPLAHSAHPSRSQPPRDEGQKRGSPPSQPLRAECPPGLHPGTVPPAGWHVASHSASQPCPKGISDFEGDPRHSVHCTFQGSRRQL